MSTELSQKTDFVEAIKRLLIQQFKGKPNFEAFLAAIAESMQDIEDMLIDMWQARWIDNATGAQLDGIGAIVGVARNNLDDDTYRIRIRVRIRLNLSNGTPDDILKIVRLLSTDATTLNLTEYPPASFLLEAFGGITQELAEEIALAIDQARSAGVQWALIFSEYEEDDTFAFAEGSTPEDDLNRGFLYSLQPLETLAETSLHLVADDWTEGTDWADRSSANNDGTRVGTPELENAVNFPERKCIRAAQFEGFHAAGDDFDATTERTYEIICDDFGSDTVEYVIGRHDGSFVQVANWLTKIQDVQVESAVYPNPIGVPTWIGSSSYTVPDRTTLPVFYTIVVDGPNRTIKVYCNGVLAVQNGNPLSGSLGTPTGLRLGIFSRWNQSSFPIEFFSGTIMEIARHEKLMDQTEVTARTAPFVALIGGNELGGRLTSVLSNT